MGITLSAVLLRSHDMKFPTAAGYFAWKIWSGEAKAKFPGGGGGGGGGMYDSPPFAPPNMI